MIKSFLTISIATALAVILPGCNDKAKPLAEHPAAEQVFINGAIYTADPAQRSVSAMAQPSRHSYSSMSTCRWSTVSRR